MNHFDRLPLELIINITDHIDISCIRLINRSLLYANLNRFYDNIKFNDKSINFLLQTYDGEMIFYSKDFCDPQHSGCSNNHGSATFIHHNVSPRAFHYYMDNSEWFGIYYGKISCRRDNINVKSYQNYINLWEDESEEVWNVKIINIDLIAMYNLLKSITSINVAKCQIIKCLKDMHDKLSLPGEIFNTIYINMWFVTNAMIMNILPSIHDIDSRIEVPLPESDSENDDFIVEVDLSNIDNYPHISAESYKLKDECHQLYPQLLEKIHLLCC